MEKRSHQKFTQRKGSKLKPGLKFMDTPANIGYPTYFHSERSPSESSLFTEAITLLKGIGVAVVSGSRRIVAKTNNVAIINAINGAGRPRGLSEALFRISNI